jgi:hypothetical protein
MTYTYAEVAQNELLEIQCDGCSICVYDLHVCRKKVAQNELLEIPFVPGRSLVSNTLCDEITAELQKVQQEAFSKVAVASADI